MANTIQIKRGTGTSALAAGELGFNTSTNTLYIGTSAGNTIIGGAGLASDIANSLSETFALKSDLGSYLPLSGGTITGALVVEQGIYLGKASTSASRFVHNNSPAYLEMSTTNGTNTRTLRINSHSSNSNNAGGLEYVVNENSSTTYHSVYTDYNIVYSSTQPTNPIKGMIWLKP